MSIRQRIYWSFLSLVFLFVINAVITVFTLNSNRKLSDRLTQLVEPSLGLMDEFRTMMIESKMYTTNWVFLRSRQEDKELLIDLHRSGYPDLKRRMIGFAGQWTIRENALRLDSVLAGFEQLLKIEKGLMASLRTFDDYNDPVIRLDAERQIEEEVLPRTASLMNTLDTLVALGEAIRKAENDKLDATTARLRIFIVILAITIIFVGLLLSAYLTRLIIGPLNKIRKIINDLGKGITKKIETRANGDEIGKMVLSVNNLSGKLQATATFAHEVGMRNFTMPFKPLSDEDTLGKALIAMRNNLRRSEAGLETKNSELERKNKELEQFAYVASHDLQEPLRTISSFVKVFRKNYQDALDDKGKQYLTYLMQASDRMQVFITDLLEYSRIGNEKELEKVDCNDILSEVMADLDTAIAESGAKIKGGKLPIVIGYRTEIKQLFQNLLFNAIKFRKKGLPPRITISAKPEKEGWQFEFADNGIGIARENHERIFIIFQRLHTRNEYTGSGIGLSHCKKIVELHKGKIWLESEPGRGTTFYFTLKNNEITHDKETQLRFAH